MNATLRIAPIVFKFLTHPETHAGFISLGKAVIHFANAIKATAR